MNTDTDAQKNLFLLVIFVLLSFSDQCFYYLGLTGSARLLSFGGNALVSSIFEFPSVLNITSATGVPSDGYLLLYTYKTLKINVKCNFVQPGRDSLKREDHRNLSGLAGKYPILPDAVLPDRTDDRRREASESGVSRIRRPSLRPVPGLRRAAFPIIPYGQERWG